MTEAKTPILTNSKPCFKEFRLEKNKILENLGLPHVESYNYFLDEGIKDCLSKLNPLEFELPNGEKLFLQIEDCFISNPEVRAELIDVFNKKIYPTECRQRASTYSGMVTLSLAWTKNGQQQPSVSFDLGEIPAMVKSKNCNLFNADAEQLVKHFEHEREWGGYFVVKGHEKLIRMLLMTRRNYPLSIKRSTWKDRGRHFSEYGIFIRCVQSDQTSTNNVLHFLNNGTAKIMFSHQKALSYLPVMLILKSLVNYTDEKIYNELVNGFETDQYYKSCVQNMLTEMHEQGLHSYKSCKNYLGQAFRPRYTNLPEWYTNEQICDFIHTNNILIHLNSNLDKFNLIVFMVKKLFQVVQGKSKLEGADCVMMQELLLGGHLYQKLFKEFLERWLVGLKYNLIKKTTSNELLSIKGADVMMAGKYSSNIKSHFEHFLSTGNLISKSGLGLMQNSGLVIQAENINRMRYMSHFRAVHRGSYFVEMRTTEARQLLPDAWGFICPVHTPDGSPCGLLNHLTVDCVASKDIMHLKIISEIPMLLAELGMVPIDSLMAFNLEDYYTVMLEGCVIGYLKIDRAVQVTNYLRGLKIEGKKLPQETEIVLVQKKMLGQYPGLFLFVGSARMMRPVFNLAHQKIEFIGTFEQVYLDIAVKEEELYPNVTTHLELSKLSFLSNLANLIPMPDCNQSPRNMYQCQMGKQTMGTPCHNWLGQAQTKLYRLQTPATPLFRPLHHDKIELDDFAMGTNAIVAVISYSGYDMEDAMIINKSAFQRGFGHGCIYHSDFIELSNDSYFARDPKKENLALFLDTDGLPHPGQKIHYGDPLYCYFDMDENTFRIKKFEGKEMVVVDNVKQCGTLILSAPKKVCITTRIPRNPSVGDKFASRAGQKGICSHMWPSEDLPFTESGLIPDILFNPHGFPSRMTIAMMIETMAGKTAAMRGEVHDATPFVFDEQNTAIDYFGKQLADCGYNYFGTERMYSGVDGRELKADIFFGVVHYQRLRHMVSDKWQVRSTGAIDLLTRQPMKGRKRGGGVRFGEMERDALIAHGASFLLQDRLLHCSDKTTALICRNCCSLLGPMDKVEKRSQKSVVEIKPETCRLCGNGDNIAAVEIPYVFKFLVTQLSSMNINVKLNYNESL